ncbi:hypothetical protein BDC45DRAFT_533493 [Circinella umbellata]|nr:hypothetical protein BDC45DRAFT_533493 [Circinella umbellata]
MYLINTQKFMWLSKLTALYASTSLQYKEILLLVISKAASVFFLNIMQFIDSIPMQYIMIFIRKRSFFILINKKFIKISVSLCLVAPKKKLLFRSGLADSFITPQIISQSDIINSMIDVSSGKCYVYIRVLCYMVILVLMLVGLTFSSYFLISGLVLYLKRTH